jgi:glycosyltransferase involved in cell wall biosynthesis
VRRVRLIPIGSNIPNNPPEGYSRDAWRRSHGVGESATLLAYFGFLNSTKGLNDLLNALAILVQRGDYRLVMVGGGLGSSDPTNRSTAQRLNRLARDLGISDHLIWTGYLEPAEVSAALLAADMAVLPYADGASFRRGSLLAALEHGLPVITTSPGQGLEDWGREDQVEYPELRHEQNGLLVEPGDPAALVEAIQLLAADPELRARIASGAAELARFFAWDRIAEMHEALYEELTNDE